MKERQHRYRAKNVSKQAINRAVNYPCLLCSRLQRNNTAFNFSSKTTNNKHHSVRKQSTKQNSFHKKEIYDWNQKKKKKARTQNTNHILYYKNECGLENKNII